MLNVLQYWNGVFTVHITLTWCAYSTYTCDIVCDTIYWHGVFAMLTVLTSCAHTCTGPTLGGYNNYALSVMT